MKIVTLKRANHPMILVSEENLNDREAFVKGDLGQNIVIN